MRHTNKNGTDSAARFALQRTNSRRLPAAAADNLYVNDVHSQLNSTRLAGVERPGSIEHLQWLVRRAARRGLSVSVAGGRHAMGGQQFGTDTMLLDMSGMRRIVKFDPARPEVEVGAGILWPDLIEFLVGAQSGRAHQFGIRQKQTGADRLSLGGALAANIHGRGLTLKPIIDDVESFVLVDAEGEARTCSREENAELFRLAVGGYGLFGVIASVTLRLAPRRKVERVVELARLCDLDGAFRERIADGFLYGDFQFMTDRDSDDFLRRGVFSCYRPAPDDAPVPPDQRELSADEWKELLYLAHADRRRAFEVYSSHYLSTAGQIYWTDTHQLSVYLDDYHRDIDRRLGAAARATEMITEAYVPRERLNDFMEAVRDDFRAHAVELIYGTIRLIERDDESFLAWARDPYACVVFNLHVTHNVAGLEKAKSDFRRIIDRAIQFGGSFYLTYHRWARRDQVERCYPQLPEFLRLKRRHDPRGLFQSDWYRHYAVMFADAFQAGGAAGRRACSPLI